MKKDLELDEYDVTDYKISLPLAAVSGAMVPCCGALENWITYVIETLSISCTAVNPGVGILANTAEGVCPTPTVV